MKRSLLTLALITSLVITGFYSVNALAWRDSPPLRDDRYECLAHGVLYAMVRGSHTSCPTPTPAQHPPHEKDYDPNDPDCIIKRPLM